MKLPKPSGRIRRGIKAVGRGLARAGRAVVHGAKVATGRQLSEKRLTEISGSGVFSVGKGGPLGEEPYYKGKLPTMQEAISKDAKGGIHIQRGILKTTTVKQWHYTPEGKLKAWQIANMAGGKKIVYSPPGRFIGQRVLLKRLLRGRNPKTWAYPSRRKLRYNRMFRAVVEAGGSKDQAEYWAERFARKPIRTLFEVTTSPLSVIDMIVARREKARDRARKRGIEA
jgi:hypothetical protein